MTCDTHTVTTVHCETANFSSKEHGEKGEHRYNEALILETMWHLCPSTGFQPLEPTIPAMTVCLLTLYVRI